MLLAGQRLLSRENQSKDKLMSAQPYKRPPITEAVIEVRFAEPIEFGDVAKVSADFKALYQHEEIVKNLSVQLDISAQHKNIPPAQITNQQAGYRLTSLDQTKILLLMPLTFAISQLAPYPGWVEFFSRFVRNWQMWKKAVAYRKISRIGVRYINRIDIPVSGPVIEEEDFIEVYPHLPDVLGPMRAYGVQTQLPILEIGCNLTLNSSLIQSPLLGHVSIVLDQDIAKEVEVPQNDEAMYKLLNEIRVKKNSVFEACMTDRARELFQK